MGLHPMTHVSELRRIAQVLRDELGPPNISESYIERLEKIVELEALADEMFRGIKITNAARTKVWSAISVETFPNFIPFHPEAERLLSLMRYNDVT